jgi:hypothetical protein
VLGVYGAGLSANVRSAYGFLAHNYNPGDQIYFFGFSRGAYTARAIAGLVTSFGLLTKKGMDNFSHVYQEYYEKQDKTTGPNLVRLEELAGGKANLHDDAKESVEIIGVWDTVGFHETGWTGEKFEFYNTKLSGKVKYGFHALSLDETGKAFLPTLWDSDADSPGGKNATQVWFSGTHSGVGGGNQDSGLADISLAWMIAKCHETKSLSFVDIHVPPSSSSEWYLCPPGGISGGIPATATGTGPANPQWSTVNYPRKGQAQAGFGLGLIKQFAEGLLWRVSNLILRPRSGIRTPNAKSFPPDKTNERLHQSIKDRRLADAWPCVPIRRKIDATKLWALAHPHGATIEETEPDAVELAFKGRIRPVA